MANFYILNPIFSKEAMRMSILSIFRRLFSVIIFTAIATSTFCIEVDLKLNQKPPHIPAYEWCKMRANLLVKEKLKAVLACLQMSMEQLVNKVKNCRKGDLPKPVISKLSELDGLETVEISDRIATCVFRFFQNPNVRKEVGLINITRKKDEIIVETQKVGVIKIFQNDNILADV